MNNSRKWARRPARKLLLRYLLLVVAASVRMADASAQADESGGAYTFRSPADTPAIRSALAPHSPLLAVTAAGARLVAVGLRGHIVYSDDSGHTWIQAAVPVQSDLVAVSFPTPLLGWAVGHGGVVLRSTDGGKTWIRQFAGEQLTRLATSFYQQQPSLPPKQLTAINHALDDQPVPSLLGVWFESADEGTIVGTFNTIYRTADGGKTWTPWMDRVDNPDGAHFYAVAGGGGVTYLAGEKGKVWRLDHQAQRWTTVPTGYAGTLFGLIADGQHVLAYGMRGSTFVSSDGGTRWQQVAMRSKAGITAGIQLRGGQIVLVDQTGGLVRSGDGGQTFAPRATNSRMAVFGMAQAADARLISVGPAGASVLATQ